MNGAEIHLFDTHAHLTDETFSADTGDVITRARDVGVTKILIIGIDSASSRRASDLADKFDLKFTAGIHPHEADLYSPRDLNIIEELSCHPRCAAIGEIGLDFYRQYSDRENQLTLFNSMLKLAERTGKPVVLHQRAAEREVLGCIDEFKLKGGGVFHCFSGDMSHADQALRRGFYVSFAGNVGYRNSELLDLAAMLPLERILIETDAPYVPPHPHRGRRNEPAYVRFTAQTVADARGMRLEEFAKAASENGSRLFGWG